MKKLLVLGICSVIFLSSCEQVERLSVEEVMERAVKANKDRKEAQFMVDGTYVFDTDGEHGVSGTAKINGFYLNGGESVKGKINTNARLPIDDETTLFQLESDFVLLKSSDPFIKFLRADSNPLHPLTMPMIIEPILNKWWRIPLKDVSKPETAIAPDPQLIRAQSQVIRVVSDNGFDFVNNRRAYRYEIVLDQEKLKAYLDVLALESNSNHDKEEIINLVEEMEARGELWVDAESFQISKIRWTIAPFGISEASKLALSFTIVFFENEISSIEAPSDAAPLSLENIIGSMGDTKLKKIESPLPNDLENAIIEEIIGVTP